MIMHPCSFHNIGHCDKLIPQLAFSARPTSHVAPCIHFSGDDDDDDDGEDFHDHRRY